MKYFNTAGPVNQPDHYKIDPLSRWDLEEIMTLISQRKYFILHAPRQSGKTSCMLALQDYINAEGKYFALYTNAEVGQASLHDVKSGVRAIVAHLADRLSMVNEQYSIEELLNIFNETEAEVGLNRVLSYISRTIKKPFILFIDEIDSLIGDTLISVLRQLRAGYDMRPDSFPSTVILCGVRDVRDYRIRSSRDEIVTGGSAFNIKAKSLGLGNFSRDDIVNLYSQHTIETGQTFAEECYDVVMKYTDGQPWLVNALAYQVTYEMIENRDRSVNITAKMFEIAKEELILERQTHLDQLADKLKEERVRNVILPMVMGTKTKYTEDDYEYCIDLGLIKKTNNGIEIANKIYHEIIPRELTKITQRVFFSDLDVDWVNLDGSANIRDLLTLFKDFWNENASIWESDINGYQEAAPHLVTQAFFQRIINGGGYINREYGLGIKRTDLYIKWKYIADGQLKIQNIVIEIKTISEKQTYESVKKQALDQTANYAKICGTPDAHILIFDRNSSQNWSADEPNEIIEHEGVLIEIWKLGQGTW